MRDRKSFRNCFVEMRQGNKELIDYFNEKLTLYHQLYPNGEKLDTFETFHDSFLRGMQNLQLGRKIMECNPQNLGQLRQACIRNLEGQD